VATLRTESTGSPPICQNKKLIGRFCTRYVTGYDITGITNTIHLNTDGACSCMAACMAAHATCDSWVWKFTGLGQSLRVCTLYSNFNLPPAVTLDYSGNQTAGAADIEGNPQAGGYVPACTLPDGTTADPHCVSGALWQVGANQFLC